MCLRSLVTLLLLPLSPFIALAQSPPAPDRPPDRGLLLHADAIASKVASLRALPVRARIQKDLKTRQALRQVLLQKIEHDFTPEQFLHESMVYQRLDLLPAGTDYKRLILDLYTQQIAGFYDPETKKLSLIAGLPSPLQRATMAHEIFHAIQDQHFPLAQLQHAPDDFQDYRIARHALIEGDATLLTLDFTLHEQGELPREGGASMAQVPALRSALGALKIADAAALGGMFTPNPEADAPPLPPMITQNMLFPYVEGLRFVLAAFDHFGAWKPMQALYASPPVSTEQILHPERYFQNDQPTLLTFAPDHALPAGWAQIYTAQLGEFQMRLILEQWSLAPPQSAQPPGLDPEAAAAGWDGDRMVAWTSPQGHVLVAHMSVWDTPEDAVEYYQAMQQALGNRWRHATSSMTLKTTQGRHGQASCIAHTTLTGPAPTLEHAYLEQWGDLVLLIEGLPASQGQAMGALRNALFSTLKRTPWAALPASTFQMQTPSPSNAPSK